MAYRIPFKINTSAEFSYGTLRVTLGPIRWNPYFECWMATYKDSAGALLYNIPLRAGVDCLLGMNVGLPSLFAINKYDMKSDPTINGDFYLFVIDKGDIPEEV